jgi:phospholipid/cholesterol/gamma-HCH transport system substrate-binding protein
LVKFTSKVTTEKNVLSKLISNPKLGKSVDSMLINLEKRVTELKELEEAAKSNFLLKAYFKKKEKQAAEKKH